MKKRLKVIPLIWILVLISVALPQTATQTAKENSEKAQAAKTATQAPRPLEVSDVASWKRVQQPTVSNNGQWFAYRLAPNEGDTEVVVRRLSDDKEMKFPAGEGGFAPLSFSDDAKWIAFTAFPTAKETKRLRKERKPIQTRVVLVNLATEKKTEFEKIRRFAFSGELAGWIALHRSGDGQAAGAPASPFPTPPGPAASGGPAQPDRATGTDLILYELSTGNQLNIGNVSEFAFDKKGNHLALVIDAAEKTGNGIQLRDMATGAVVPLDSDKANYRGLNWNEEGTAFAALKGVEDKKYEDKLYSVVAFSIAGSGARKVVYDPKEDKSFPADMTVSPNRSPAWTDDMSALLFGIHPAKKKENADKAGDEKKEGDSKPDPRAAAAAAMRRDEPDKPDLVIWHHKDSRLQSQQQVQERFDKNFSYTAIYRIEDKKFIRLADDDLRQVAAAPKHKYAVGLDNRPYEYTGNLDGLRYQDVYVVDLKSGARKLALKKSRNYYGPSPDGTHFLYYDDGHFFTYDMTSGQSHNITQKVPSVFYNTEDDHNIIKPPRFPVGWAKDGVSVLLSDGWDIWNVPVHGGQGTNLTGNGKKDQVRYRSRFRLDPEEKGIDLSKPMYVGMYGELTKKTGIALIENGKMTSLLWDDAAFGSLMKAKDADRYLYTRETYEAYPDYYVADASLKGGRRLTDANPQQKNFLWSKGAKLIEYVSAKGDKLQGALYLPSNYEPGKSYPTIVYIYEKLSQGLNFYTSPSVGGFNKSLYTSQGYAVLMPDIVYKVNDPGMSAVWCVLPALEAAIKTGVVDRSRVAIHGHSWGGYQTAFLITQTDAFKAAIAGAPLTNMISMYSLIYWNTGSANQPIFESSQGRFTTGYWDNMESYARNSPVYHAKNVKTPLIILHNDKDGAVDFTQGIEYFNTLRRLGKSVVMLQYKGENHGLAKLENRKDYSARMLEFFDHHLKGKPAPAWLKEGVPHLKMKEHLDERVKEAKDKPEFDNR
jgi:acetyl esterase/lipase